LTDYLTFVNLLVVDIEQSKITYVYYDRHWAASRKLFLDEHPLCRFCEDAGRIEAATVVDHINPHKGDYDLFWDKTNWQALCAICHASAKQRQERGVQSGRVGVDGWKI